MTIVPFRFRTLSAIAWLSLAASGSAPAQTAGQVTPPSFAPDGARPHPQTIVSGLPLAAQAPAAGEGRRTVHLREVQLYGSMPALQGASAAMVRRLQNQTVTIDDIYAAAHALESAYAQAGHVLMRVDLVPDQIKDDWPLRLNLVSAYIDRIDIAGVAGRDQARVAATLTPLVGHRDMTLGEILEYADARTVAPIDDLSTPVNSHYKRLSVRYKTDHIGGRDWMTSQEIGFDATGERVGLAGNDTAALDRLRILRFANAFAWHIPNSGALTGRMEFSVGLDKLGARSAEEDVENGTTLSRAGSTDTLRKLGLNLDYTQAFTPHLALDVKGRGQTSFSMPLAYSEMLDIASPDGLSSFNRGTLPGDAGYVARGEISSPWQVSGRGVTIDVIPYLFAGYGAMFRYDATPYEHSAVHAADYGIGVRLVSAPNFHALGLRGAGVTLELGKQHRDDGRSNGTQFTVTGAA